MTNHQKQVLLTAEGLKELQKEYEELTKVKRPKAVERLATSRQMGDLAENNEHTQAREALSFMDGRISELEEVINRAALIDKGHGKCQEIKVGCKVTVQAGKKEEHVFHLVGEWEADPTEKKISHQSPLGQSLVGRKVGDKVEVKAPAGKVIYKITKID